MQYINYAEFIILVAIASNAVTTSAYNVVNIGCKDLDLASDATTDTVTYQDGTLSCTHKSCACQSLESAFANPTSNTMFNITTDVMLSSILLGVGLVNVIITGYNSPTIKCDKYGGGLYLSSCHNCTIENIIWDGCGTQVINKYTDPVILLDDSSNIKIKNCSFQNSIGQAIALADMAGPGDIIISHCKFMNNNVPDNGGHNNAVIYYYPSSKSAQSDINNVVLITSCIFTDNSASSAIFFNPSPVALLLKDCKFQKNQGTAVFIFNNNGLDIDGKVMFEDNVAKEGAAIYIYDYSSVRFVENSMVIFNNNKAHNNGGAIYMRNHASVLFEEGSTVLFHNNNATKGGAIAINNNCSITSKENAMIRFINNSAAVDGGAMSLYNTSVTFKSSIITANNNNANQFGGALYIRNSNITVTGKSVVNFNGNTAIVGGAAIFSQVNSNVKFGDNSIVTFINNYATVGWGGAIYMSENCYVFFENSSVVTFTNNSAGSCGAVNCDTHSHIQINDNTSVTFSRNSATEHHGKGGALCVSYNSGNDIKNNSTVIFLDNRAVYGGAVTFETTSYLLSDGNSSVLFSNNNAALEGGGALVATNSSITFKGNSFVKLSNNNANYFGGALSIGTSSKIDFIETATAVFYNNKAGERGGAIHLYKSSSVIHNECSKVMYFNNTAINGGAVYSEDGSDVTLDDESKLTFHGNMASQGGAMCLSSKSTINIKGNSTTEFAENRALEAGGGIKASDSSITITGKSDVTISNSIAEKGGAVHCDTNCRFTLAENASILFCNNQARYFGGAINLVEYSEFRVTEKSKIIFYNNTAKLGVGGAIHQVNSQSTIDDNCTVTFSNCQARYGGSVAVNQSTTTFKGYASVTFVNNTAANGRTIISYDESSIAFKENATIVFKYNPAQVEEELNGNFYSALSAPDSQIKNVIFSSGNSAVIIEKNYLVNFNNNPARWCSGELYFNCSYDVVVDSNGTVTCNGVKAFPICTNDICFCKNIDHALADLKMSDNVLIRLTKNVMLSSIVMLVNVRNFTMIGYNNPTVNCSNSGGLYFISCHDCTFEGITWSKCGSDGIDSRLAAGVTFENSSNITIQNCSFQQSVGQAVALLEVSGEVNVHQSKFVNNNHYKGHGTAIYYTSNDIKHSPLKFTMSNCNFTRNTGAMSVVYIDENKTFLHAIFILRNTSFVNNQGTPIYLLNQILYVEGRNDFVGNQAECGSCIYASNNASVIFSNHSIIKFDHNTATISGAIYLTDHARLSFEGNSKVQFNGNNATQYGGSIYSNENSVVLFEGNANVQFDSNRGGFGGAIYSEGGCHIMFDQNSMVTFDNNKAEFGGAAYVCQESSIFFMDNSYVSFQNNLANVDGGALNLYNTIEVVFMRNTSVTFYNNNALRNGGAVDFKRRSKLNFQERSLSVFSSHRADDTSGIVLSKTISKYVGLNIAIIKHKENDMQSGSAFSIILKGRSTVKFVNNKAVCGGAIYNMWNVRFTENSTVTFINNNADYGGAAYLETSGSMIFEGNSISALTNKNDDQNSTGPGHNKFSTVHMHEATSIAAFSDNTAKYSGGAVYLSISSAIIFVKESRCKAIFSRNKATNGGAVYSEENSNIILGEKTEAVFANNEATHDGGAIHSYNKSSVIITGHSYAKFYNNKATQGGAIYSKSSSDIVFKQNSTTEFINNTGLQHGGALFTKLNCDVNSEENSTVFYDNNNALINGGTVYSENNSSIVIMGYSRVKFNANRAHSGDGGAVYSNINSKFVSKASSQLTFTNNYATQGGTIYSSIGSSVVFDENTMVVFESNAAISGGALTVNSDSHVTLQGSLMSMVKFNNNKAIQYGGAIDIGKNSTVVLNGNVTTKFSNNEATLGGAVNVQDKSSITLTENSTAMFIGNKANIGGAIYLKASNTSFTINCSVEFCNNTAWQDGGAIYLDDKFIANFADNANIIFDYNTASDYGGAVYGKISQSKLYLNITNITFYKNHVRTAGNSIFINVPSSCNSTCLSNNIVGISKDSKRSPVKQSITTTPKVLKLYQPAICIKDEDRECGSYYISNIMLGEEVLVGACMYDYYDRPSDDARFVITGNDSQEYYIPGSRDVLVSCNSTMHGITLNGNNILPTSPLNYTMTITLYVDRLSEMKAISVNLTVELVSCHPGFWQYSESKKCECYNANDIVLCSGKSSTIKRGYWFGSVTGKPTTVFCPLDYCNFTCCETSNGYYHLSPERDDQCRSHRFGAACGSCKEGYSLSFDSTECVHVKNCTFEMTILVIALIGIYWLVLFGTIIFTMNSKFNIGNLYGIIYYYSVVDLLLSHSSYLSNGLYTTINVMSSITKVTPQFLGQFCLIKYMSGIDQQFIHYMHPIAISLFLGALTMAARKFSKLSSLVSVRVICCLLLLSYTSLATTSLLLMRPLRFQDVDKVYTYVSPDVEYFHGRHKFYEIWAGLSMLIVIGLPLLLGLEPFVNSKINFVKVKPLLDQFQCCYKGKYPNFFAAYYMICRLVIIIIIMVAPSSDFIYQYLLIAACVVIALIHHIFKPYHNQSLNRFDGTILQLLVLVSVLPLVEFFDTTFNSNLISGIAFVLILLPSVIFFFMLLITNKENITEFCLQLRIRICSNCNEISLSVTEESSGETEDQSNPKQFTPLEIDDSMRRNATICDV